MQDHASALHQETHEVVGRQGGPLVPRSHQPGQVQGSLLQKQNQGQEPHHHHRAGDEAGPAPQTGRQEEAS